MTKFATIVLAAGKGTRMKSGLVKVLHPIMGRPMLSYPVEVSRNMGAERTVVVVGHQAERVREAFSEGYLIFVSQNPQLGSGHAVLCAGEAFQGYDGTILILCGDVPLIQEETIGEFLTFHHREGAALTVATTCLPDPGEYGRILRQEGARLERIVEDRDASPLERGIKEINTGLYCADASFLFAALKRVKRDNRQGEYYLTDIVGIGHRDKKKMLAFQVNDPDQVMGINTRIDLARAHSILRKRYLNRWMIEGVTIVDPETTHIETDVTVGEDTVVHPFCVIRGKTSIGSRCIIGPSCHIANSRIEDRVTIRSFSVVDESKIEEGAIIGPFARLRPQTHVLADARVGNFVEVKKSVIGRGSKVNHLTYLGDSTLGEKVNIGAGTITCNYDGVAKYPTVIGNGVFVGSNTELIAPVKIGDGAFIGAGSTITRDVPEDCLAVSRTKQKNINGWGRRRRKKEK